MRTVPSNLSLADLVAKYAALTVAQRRHYNEAQTRKDFIEPLFAALGWDIHGAERDEVDVETQVSGGRADYAFKLNGVVRFYLEAKKLDDDLYNPEYAKQVITYAYNKGVPWAVLGNFVHLQVFNAEWETADLNQARVLNLTWQQYDAPDSPLRLLAREAFLNNELDRHTQTYGGMRPRLPVEKSLFAQLRHWREVLFTQIARYRPDLSLAQVDEAIQRLLNRLVFIRTCEDRHIEEAKLRAALHQWEQHGHRPELVEMLKEIWREYDVNYDSELFAPLALADTVFVEAMELKSILRGLYEPPRSLASYDFAVIDADVLGQVYEQYLGHVAQIAKERATQQQRQLALGLSVPLVQLEAKRGKRKEHGIYYTPKWVVEYIVRQTVGRYLQEHTYHEALNLKILDPACGSGSFLIRAFDTLSEYHAQVQGKPAAALGPYERLRILTRNICGVDLDQQAVEIARLNLLLRSLARRERLPYLSGNVQRGNSLISGGEAELRPYFGDAWREKEPFDWRREFPEIMAQGGFDIIIGNPPYVRLHELPWEDRRFYADHFGSAFGQYDIYVLFIEKGLALLKEGGRLGFITSSKFFAADYGERVRKHILDTCCIESVVDVSEFPVFKEAAVYPYVFVLRKERDSATRRSNAVAITPGVASANQFVQGELITVPVPQRMWEDNEGYIFDCVSAQAGLLASIERRSVRLGDVCMITRGFRPPPRDLLVSPREYCLLDDATKGLYKRMVTGKSIKGPYALHWDGTYLKYESARIPEAKDPSIFASPKVMITDISFRPEAYFDSEGYYCPKTIYLILLRPNQRYDLRYITGILNSRLMTVYFRSRFSAMHMRGSYLRFRKQFLQRLPIRLLDLDDPADKRRHDEIVSLVERMLELHRRRAAKGEVRDEERADIEREIARTDRQIDDLVYDLYGLMPEERRLVEEM